MHDRDGMVLDEESVTMIILVQTPHPLYARTDSVFPAEFHYFWALAGDTTVTMASFWQAKSRLCAAPTVDAHPIQKLEHYLS